MKNKDIKQYELQARDILSERYGVNGSYFTSELNETITQLILLDLMTMLEENDIVKYIQFDKEGRIKVNAASPKGKVQNEK